MTTVQWFWQPQRSWRMYCYRLREMRARSTGSRSPGPRSQYPASRSHHPVSNIQCPVHSYGIFRIRFALLVGRRPSVFSYGSQKTPCSYLRIGLRFCPWLPLPMPMSMSMPIVTSGGGVGDRKGVVLGDPLWYLLMCLVMLIVIFPHWRWQLFAAAAFAASGSFNLHIFIWLCRF